MLGNTAMLFSSNGLRSFAGGVDGKAAMGTSREVILEEPYAPPVKSTPVIGK